jgi:arylsulfatase A-like enzyme
MRHIVVITRWLLLAPAVIAALVVAAPAEAESAGTGGSTPDRIVLIVADTLRRDRLSIYGGSVATPNIERLAARGQVFTNAVSSFHSTSMSMAALLTGLTPSLESGVGRNALPWTGRTWCGLSRYQEVGVDEGCVPMKVSTLAEELRDAGYSTLGVVSSRHLFRPTGYDQGFDTWVEVARTLGSEARSREAEMYRNLVARNGVRVNRALFKALRERKSDRFFLYVHYLDVHDYLYSKDKSLSMDAMYAAAIQIFDRNLGDLIRGLEAAGLLENALVVLTSDHGERLGEEHAVPGTRGHMGNPSFETVLHIPLIAAPAISATPEELIRSEDVAGLLKRAAGLTQTGSRLFDEGELYISERDYQTLRRGRWKSFWHRESDQVLLFDLYDDPGETKNRAAVHPEELERHRKRIDALTKSLSSETAARSELSPEDRDTLRALGYLE